MARAVLKGVNPYLPLPELANLLLGPIYRLPMQHPTPHPPTIALLVFPLGFLPLGTAEIVWFVLEIYLVMVAVHQLLKIWKIETKPWQFLLIALLALAWQPVVEELVSGQLTLIMLVCLLGVWKNLREDKQISSGLFLGALMAVKLLGWPIAVFLLLRSKWKAAGTALAVLLVGNIVAGLWMGFDRVLYYYLNVSSTVALDYRQHEGNFSLWTIGARLFEGTGVPGASGIQSPPIYFAPGLAGPVTLGLLLAALGLSLWLALRAKDIDTALSILVCASLLLSPVVWVWYFILLIVPLSVIGFRLSRAQFEMRETNLFILVCLLLFFPRELLVTILNVFVDPSTRPLPTVPLPWSLVTLMPQVVMLVCLWLVWHLGKLSERVLPANIIPTITEEATKEQIL